MPSLEGKAHQQFCSIFVSALRSPPQNHRIRIVLKPLQRVLRGKVMIRTNNPDVGKVGYICKYKVVERTTDHGCAFLKPGAEFSTVVLEITEECFKKQHSEHC